MALKKSTKPQAEPVAKPKAASTEKVVATKAAADTATKAGTPKVAAKPTVKAAKPPAAVKLTDKQATFLKQIRSATEPGYKGDKKAEAKTLESLLGKKLIKKGAKDKTSGAYHFTVSKAGEKHLSQGDQPASV